MPNDQALSELACLLHDNQIYTDRATVAYYSRDWLDLFEPDAAFVVFPASIAEIESIVCWANRWLVGLVPSGGRTGLSGGAVATDGEVVVSLEKMNGIIAFNDVDRSLTVQAGVTLETIQQYAHDKGLFYPVNLASKGSCQIGGNVATDAGGTRVFYYGHTRHWIRGAKVVTGQGHTLDLNRALVKNATGYDFRHLWLGSEGTLGIIGEVDLALTEPPGETAVMMISLKALEYTYQALEVFRQYCSLHSFEFFSRQALEQVLAAYHWLEPCEQGAYYVLLEAEATGAKRDDLEKAFERLYDQDTIIDGVVGQSARQDRELWAYREHITEALSRYHPYKCDVAVRPSRMGRFVRQLEQWVDRLGDQWQVICFGHLGDGNVHVNVLKPDSLNREQFIDACSRLIPELYKLVNHYHGAISAEHGIGLLKREHLRLMLTESELDYMRQIKRVFDPNHIMNPGKLIAKK